MYLLTYMKHNNITYITPVSTSVSHIQNPFIQTLPDAIIIQTWPSNTHHDSAGDENGLGHDLSHEIMGNPLQHTKFNRFVYIYIPQASWDPFTGRK